MGYSCVSEGVSEGVSEDACGDSVHVAGFYCHCVSAAIVYSWSILGWSCHCQCFSGTYCM